MVRRDRPALAGRYGDDEKLRQQNAENPLGTDHVLWIASGTGVARDPVQQHPSRVGIAKALLAKRIRDGPICCGDSPVAKLMEENVSAADVGDMRPPSDQDQTSLAAPPAIALHRRDAPVRKRRADVGSERFRSQIQTLLPTRFVARSNIPSSARLLRGHSRYRGRRCVSAFPTPMRICRGP